MSTKRVYIEAEECLEGVLEEGAGKGGVVICPPNPIYGGSMWNNVVDAIEEGFLGLGFSTLRFNFRGVGSSSGRHDRGVGEVRDVIAAARFMKGRMGQGEVSCWPATPSAPGSAEGSLRGRPGCRPFLVAYPFSATGLKTSCLGPGGRGARRGCAGSLAALARRRRPLDSLHSVYKDLKRTSPWKVIARTTSSWAWKRRSPVSYERSSRGKVGAALALRRSRDVDRLIG
jgi:hypothetical protein